MLENPFRYGDVATGAYFTNREEELAELLSDMRSGQNVVIISPRRYGKTSLVLKARASIEAEGALVAYMDLFRTPTKELLAEHLANAIYDGLVSAPEKAWKKTVDVFKSLPISPKFTLGQDGTPVMEFGLGERARDADRLIESLLSLPGKIARDRKKRVVLVMDEFQEVVSIDPSLPARMRAIFQLQPDVSHVFLGSKRHLMQKVFTEVNEPMYKLAKPLPLAPISDEAFAHFIRGRFEGTGLSIDDAAIAAILSTTEGHPHDTQELCYFAWSLAQAGQAPVDRPLIARALQRVLAAEDARYKTLWDSLPAGSKLILTALATDEQAAIFAESYRRRHRLGAASSVQRAVTRLLESDVIETTRDGTYRIPDAFLRAWLKSLTRA
jgi:AAA+ ATPase superfamily predicted ATPase